MSPNRQAASAALLVRARRGSNFVSTSDLSIEAESSVSPIIHVCGWCKSVHWKQSIWLSAQNAAPLLADKPGRHRMTHGICGDCLVKAMAT